MLSRVRAKSVMVDPLSAFSESIRLGIQRVCAETKHATSHLLQANLQKAHQKMFHAGFYASLAQSSQAFIHQPAQWLKDFQWVKNNTYNSSCHFQHYSHVFDSAWYAKMLLCQKALCLYALYEQGMEGRQQPFPHI